MGETTNSKIKPVYFNLDDEDESILYEKACGMNFSRWVKKQLNGKDNHATPLIRKEDVGRDDIIDKENREIQNKEIESMMI